MSIAELTAIAAIAAMAGILGTMLGLGGGVFLVPILTIAFGVELKTAVAASAIAVVANSCSGSSGYLKRRFTNVRLALVLLVSTTFGALVGGLLAVSLPEAVLKSAFAGLLLLVALSMARRRPIVLNAGDEPPPPDPYRLSAPTTTLGWTTSSPIPRVTCGWPCR